LTELKVLNFYIRYHNTRQFIYL